MVFFSFFVEKSELFSKKEEEEKLFFVSPGMSDQKLDEMIAKADVDNNG